MPETRKKTDTKHQAKLGFTPVAEESTQAQQLSPSVRSRASAVRYYSPKKGSEKQKALLEGGSKTSKRSKAKQQRLDFNSRHLRSSARLAQSDGLIDQNDQIYASQHKSSPGPRRGLPPSSGRGQRSIPGAHGSDISLTSPEPMNSRNGSFSKPPRSSPPETNAVETDDSDEDILLPPMGSRGRPQILDDDDDIEDEEIVEALLPSVNKSHEKKGTMDPDDEDQPILTSSSKHRRKSTRQISDQDMDISEDTTINDEEEAPVLTSPSRRSRRSNIVISEQNSDDEDDDDDEPVISSSARVSKRLQKGSKDETSSPVKRRRLQHGPKPRKTTREEQDEEVLEDAQDLQDTATLNEGLRSSSKLNEKKLARQRELNKLLKRRNKNAGSSSRISSPSTSPSPEAEEIIPFNDIYSDEDSSEVDSLINDDEDLSDNASETSEMRINRCIYSIPSALHYTIQHILHEKFLPSATPPTPNAYYTAAHNLISKRLESYRNQFLSSVWRRPFIASLYARPTLTWPSNAIPLWESCEACGRRDRPATYAISFEGSCYEEQTLRNVPDEESPVWQKYDEVVPPDRVWHVGVDCHDNAWRAHRAAHWRFGLKVQVERVLGKMGVEVDADVDADTELGNGGGSNDESDRQREDRFQAVLLQMEEQGYMQVLQKEFMERFEMEDEEDDDDDY